ncbi:hypothetical protein BL14DL4_00105 [Bacillus licheniformis]|nr:hypothetical protein BL14DL4_00105 [Bacillus licheniformis]
MNFKLIKNTKGDDEMSSNKEFAEMVYRLSTK